MGFKTGNRNAASHLWASYILDRAGKMDAETFENVFKGFCPISGSPVDDAARRLYKIRLPKVTGGFELGTVRHCCWPCICDDRTHVYIDRREVNLKTGPKTYNFLVIGDPCDHPKELHKMYTDPFDGYKRPLSSAAPNVRCSGGKLQGATYSANGFPIIGLLFTDAGNLKQWEATPQAALAKDADESDDTFGWGSRCTERMKNGYNSGMGLIFHLVASISPIEVNTVKTTLKPVGTFGTGKGAVTFAPLPSTEPQSSGPSTTTSADDEVAEAAPKKIEVQCYVDVFYRHPSICSSEGRPQTGYACLPHLLCHGLGPSCLSTKDVEKATYSSSASRPSTPAATCVAWVMAYTTSLCRQFPLELQVIQVMARNLLA